MAALTPSYYPPGVGDIDIDDHFGDSEEYNEYEEELDWYEYWDRRYDEQKDKDHLLDDIEKYQWAD